MILARVPLLCTNTFWHKKKELVATHFSIIAFIWIDCICIRIQCLVTQKKKPATIVTEIIIICIDLYETFEEHKYSAIFSKHVSNYISSCKTEKIHCRFMSVFLNPCSIIV